MNEGEWTGYSYSLGDGVPVGPTIVTRTHFSAEETETQRGRGSCPRHPAEKPRLLHEMCLALHLWLEHQPLYFFSLSF